jgi:hypothetical protein
MTYAQTIPENLSILRSLSSPPQSVERLRVPRRTQRRVDVGVTHQLLNDFVDGLSKDGKEIMSSSHPQPISKAEWSQRS